MKLEDECLARYWIPFHDLMQINEINFGFDDDDVLDHDDETIMKRNEHPLFRCHHPVPKSDCFLFFQGHLPEHVIVIYHHAAN